MAIDSFTSILSLEDLVQGNRIKIKRVELAMTKIYQHIQDNRFLSDHHGWRSHRISPATNRGDSL